MVFSARKTDFKGIEAVEMAAGGYYALICPTLGSNVIRFRDNTRDIEVFRYSEDMTVAEFLNAPEIWGLPTLYLPNRFDAGVLRTSDAVYKLPVNEGRFGNHLHGFIQKRAHSVKSLSAEGGRAVLVTSFKYDSTDFFYNCFPVSFTAELTFELSEEGLRHTVMLKNESSVMMPISVATHTTYNAPFVKGARQGDIRLTVPAAERLQFNEKRWLPNGITMKLNDYDKEYLTGKCPVLTDICNDMYISGETELDGKPFRGTIMTDTASGKAICNEIDENYRFWIVWNDEGFKDYFCAEPMTAQVNAPNLDMPAEKTGYCELKPGEEYTVSQRFFCIG